MQPTTTVTPASHWAIATIFAATMGTAMACGGDGSDNPGDEPAPPIDEVCPPSADSDATYVIDAIDVPRSVVEAASIDFGFDIDEVPGDSVDNQIGGALASLALFGLDTSGAVTASVNRGDAISLLAVRANSMEATACAEVRWFLGANPAPAPCADADDEQCGGHLQGDGSFDVAQISPDDIAISGVISERAFATGTSDGEGADTFDIVLALSLIEGMPVAEFRLRQARISIAEVSEDGLLGGKLGGAIVVGDLEETLLPAIELSANTAIAAVCTGAAPECCEAGSEEALLLTLFDTDRDCSISIAELEENPAISELLAPDLDLLDGDGEYVEGGDGMAESMSLGFRFSAVPAAFELP